MLRKLFTVAAVSMPSQALAHAGHGGHGGLGDGLFHGLQIVVPLLLLGLSIACAALLARHRRRPR